MANSVPKLRAHLEEGETMKGFILGVVVTLAIIYGLYRLGSWLISKIPQG